ncbi:MAG: hypothetical protein AB7E49_01500 [Campylobacterales bacterium]
MDEDLIEFLISKIPQGPSPQAALLTLYPSSRFDRLQDAVEAQEGRLDCYKQSELARLGTQAARSYELMIIDNLSPDAAVLESCWQTLENSALLIAIDASEAWLAPLEAAGFSNPACIDLKNRCIVIAHKSFAWGSQEA